MHLYYLIFRYHIISGFTFDTLTNIEYMTELVMVLNWKIWENHSGKYMLSEIYEELWRKAEEWVLDHFDGDDLQYFLRTTD